MTDFLHTLGVSLGEPLVVNADHQGGEYRSREKPGISRPIETYRHPISLHARPRQGK
jgi:hypothetical protein